MTDLEKRRKYDSTLPFDDSIPKSFSEVKENFFDVFRQSFKRNSYWSKMGSGPDLGDEKTSMNEV